MGPFHRFMILRKCQRLCQQFFVYQEVWAVLSTRLQCTQDVLATAPTPTSSVFQEIARLGTGHLLPHDEV